MSVDSVSLGSTGLDELVPSRYAVQVGDIEVLVISDGVLPITARTMATNADPTEYGNWLSDMFLAQDVLDWPLNVVVVRSGGRTILVDAGLGVEFPDFPRAGQTVHRLEAAGIDPSAVTDVVLTHLHMDHVGGLLTEGLKERLRSDLRVHVATREAEFWEAPDFSHTDMPAPVPGALRQIASRFLNEYRGQIKTFETEYELAPGVLVTRNGGHTPGHSIVRLASGGDALTFAGDSVFAPGFIISSGTTGSNTIRRSPPASVSSCCGSWPRRERRWWPPTCHSLPSAMWRPTATSSAVFPPPGTTDQSLDQRRRESPKRPHVGAPSPRRRIRRPPR
jgi:glyoxylase-like metal-dependent hydrolase (beta-lactamase superfamily II)